MAEDGIGTLEETNVIRRLQDLGIDTQYFNESVYAFREVARKFDLAAANIQNEVQMRVINDQMRGFERTLLLYDGLPDRIQYRHVVTAPSLFDAYGGSAFPGIGDLLYKLEQSDEASQEYRLTVKQLRKHISDLMIITQRAAHYLQSLPFNSRSTNSAPSLGLSFMSMITFLLLALVI